MSLLSFFLKRMNFLLFLIILFGFLRSIFSAQTHVLNGVAWSYDSNSSTVINEWVGSHMPVVQVYDSFCGFWVFEYMSPFWEVRNVPMFTFQPTLLDCKNDTKNTVELIANGEQDTYLNSWLNVTKVWLAGPDGVYGNGDDRRMYLRFAHEMNGNWYPWSGNTTAYILAWQRFHNLAGKWGYDSSHVQWVWCVNYQDNGGIKMESYYPGDEYVDWVSIDGYNNAKSQSWSSWFTPEMVFDDMMNRLAALAPSKPINIAEIGCSTAGYTPEDKAQWITDVYVYLLQHNVKLILWFNIEDGYTDFAVFGSRNGTSTFQSPVNHQTYFVYEAYAQAVQKTSVALDPNNPRILTDDQFAGNFS
jgi:mannan endo-1,4-beta-mannosidase